jgi:hypothetical protein
MNLHAGFNLNKSHLHPRFRHREVAAGDSHRVEALLAPDPGGRRVRASDGTKFEEAQYILRLRGTGAFDVLIVPYRAGTRPSDLAVTRTSDGVLSVLRGGKFTALAD